MNGPFPQTAICIAKIAGAFGVSGEIKIKPFTQDPESCALYGPLYDENGQIILTPTHHRVVGTHVILRAPEIDSREAALALKGCLLYVARDSLPAIEDEDDFYYADLIGLLVKSRCGKTMGHVIAVHEFGAGDMLEIRPLDRPSKETRKEQCKESRKAHNKAPSKAKKPQSFFHPFTKQAVPKVDIDAGRIIIALIEAEIGDKPKTNDL